jgi:hypothetical protein
MIEALSFSETSVLTRVTQLNTPEDAILHSHRLKTSNLAQKIIAVYFENNMEIMIKSGPDAAS